MANIATRSKLKGKLSVCMYRASASRHLTYGHPVHRHRGEQLPVHSRPYTVIMRTSSGSRLHANIPDPHTDDQRSQHWACDHVCVWCQKPSGYRLHFFLAVLSLHGYSSSPQLQFLLDQDLISGKGMVLPRSMPCFVNAVGYVRGLTSCLHRHSLWD